MLNDNIEVPLFLCGSMLILFYCKSFTLKCFLFCCIVLCVCFTTIQQYNKKKRHQNLWYFEQFSFGNFIGWFFLMTVMKNKRKKKTFTIDFFFVEFFFLNYFHYSNEFCNKHHFVDNNLFIPFQMTNKPRFMRTFFARGLFSNE